MELKVWVDGVVRVVCGLSEETSCQDVVIALAQAIGQTGRYVLIQRLRDTERQLLASERPLESLAKLGQHSGEVQFFLRRTGPSSSDAPGSSQDRLTPLPKHPDPEPSKRNQPKKSLTFNLGPSASPKTKVKQLRRSPRDSPSPSPSPSSSPGPLSPHALSPSPSPPAGPAKEEAFRHVLQQQERLRAIEVQLESLERESRVWERPSPTPSPSPLSDARLREEVEALEQTLRRNRAELAQEPHWEEELRAEAEREKAMSRKLGELHAKMDDCGRRLHDFAARAAELEQDLQRESRGGGLQGGASGPEESLEVANAELQSKERQAAELEEQLSEAEKALGKAESLVQEKQEELAELNRELRQCNLQQFIQQAGVLPAHTHSRTDLHEQLEQLELAHLLQDSYQNGGLGLPPSESPPRPTAKQFLGHPRNLQNPLVSSLNPEVLTSRESSWR